MDWFYSGWLEDFFKGMYWPLIAVLKKSTDIKFLYLKNDPSKRKLHAIVLGSFKLRQIEQHF